MNSIHKRRIATLVALACAAAAVHAGEAVPAAPATPAPAAPATRPAPPAEVANQEQTERALVEAQKRLETAAREVSELSSQLGNHVGNRYYFAQGAPMRVHFGVQLDNSPAKDGAHVLTVSPGGPAAEAGLRNGDVITSVGGEDLTKHGNPSLMLVERVREMQPDQKVKVTVLRSGKKQDFEVTARPMPPMAGVAPMVLTPGFVTGPGTPPGVRNFRLEGQPGQQFVWNDNDWRPGDNDPGLRFRGMEFATLSEKLGSYFGVKAGVLVVRTGRNESFKLQDGDVILSIDGREPGNAQHAGRILRSYRSGEKLTLRIQRDRKAQTLEVTVPGSRRGDDRSGDNDNDD